MQIYHFSLAAAAVVAVYDIFFWGFALFNFMKLKCLSIYDLYKLSHDIFIISDFV